MVVRVATDEAPLETPSSDESGMGRSESPSDDSEPEANIIVPPDGGWGWVVVAASFLCNVLVDGIIFSGGSLLPSIQKEFQISDTKVAPVSSLVAGFYLLAGPFVSALANKYGFRIVAIAGSLISSAAISSCYFAPNVEFLYFVYGIVGGIGFCMVYMPAVVIVGFYFEKWRAVATGLALCGSGVGNFIFGPLTEALVQSYDWRKTLLVHSAFVLLCAICGATFRPIKPVRVTMADESPEDTARKHEEAVEKLNSMMKLHGNLDTGKISMPIEMNHSDKSSPHTWMGVASNTRYPTAEEVFRGSSSHLNRRSSTNSGTLKNILGKPTFIATPVAERDEQEDSNSNNENTEPLIATSIKVVASDSKPRRSHVDLISRPLYRDDIFFGASLTRLPQYTSRSSLAYHLAVTHVPTKQEAQEERSGKCRLCPEAVKRTLATMLDVSLLKSPTTLLLAFSGFFTMLGYLVPFIYLQKRATSNGMEESSAKFLVSAIGVANIIGRISCGMLSTMPKVSTLLLNNVALTLGGVATIVCGYVCNNVYQFVFCAIFGLAIASFASLRSILVVEYLGLEQLTSCYGLFLLFQGLGALMGLPIASSLAGLTNDSNMPFYVAGCFIVFSAMLCYPVNFVSRWEKARKKLTLPPKV